MQVAVKIIITIIILCIVSTCVTFVILNILKQLKHNDVSFYKTIKNEDVNNSKNEDVNNSKNEDVNNSKNEDVNNSKNEDINSNNKYVNSVERPVPKLVSLYYTGPLTKKTQQVLSGKIWDNIDVNYDLPVDQAA